MVSSSRSKASSTTTTTDNRVQADDGARVVSSGGGDLHVVADEAFELGIAALDANAALSETAIDVLAGALFKTQEAGRDDGARIGHDVVRIGFPVAAAAAIAYFLTKGN